MFSVLWQQRFLCYRLNYYTGCIDGIKGSKTRAAIKAYQKASGLGADGIWGKKTEAKAIKDGIALQTMLNTYADKGLVLDGKIGNCTINAIAATRTKMGMDKGYIADADFLAKLAASTKLPDGYISPHFALSELRCDCGGKYCDGANGLGHVDLRLVAILERARAHFGGKPINITSAIRCPKQNTLDGSSSGSRHIKAKAVDCYIGRKAGVTYAQLCAYFKRQPDVRYSYTGFGAVHVDIF